MIKVKYGGIYTSHCNINIYNISRILIVTCLLTPYRLAFLGEDHKIVLNVLEYIIDFCFLIDVIINFNSALYDEDFIVIDSRKVSYS